MIVNQHSSGNCAQRNTRGNRTAVVSSRFAWVVTVTTAFLSICYCVRYCVRYDLSTARGCFSRGWRALARSERPFGEAAGPNAGRSTSYLWQIEWSSLQFGRLEVVPLFLFQGQAKSRVSDTIHQTLNKSGPTEHGWPVEWTSLSAIS